MYTAFQEPSAAPESLVFTSQSSLLCVGQSPRVVSPSWCDQELSGPDFSLLLCSLLSLCTKRQRVPLFHSGVDTIWRKTLSTPAEQTPNAGVPYSTHRIPQQWCTEYPSFSAPYWLEFKKSEGNGRERGGAKGFTARWNRSMQPKETLRLNLCMALSLADWLFG